MPVGRDDRGGGQRTGGQIAEGKRSFFLFFLFFLLLLFLLLLFFPLCIKKSPIEEAVLGGALGVLPVRVVNSFFSSASAFQLGQVFPARSMFRSGSGGRQRFSIQYFERKVHTETEQSYPEQSEP